MCDIPLFFANYNYGPRRRTADVNLAASAVASKRQDATQAGGMLVEATRPASSPMNELLVSAIQQKRRLRLKYNGKERLVEPQCYGIGTKGTELLRVHQLRGGVEREPLFTVSKIEGLELLAEVFQRPGPNYKRGDSAMKTIFAQL